MNRSDLIIVGAGILGLSHAYHAATAGLSVTVIEKDASAQGASIRNFGMLAIVAQSDGSQKQDALRSLEVWKHVATHSNVHIKQTGCLFLARENEELEVLREYVSSGKSTAPNTKLLGPDSLKQYATALRSENLLGGLWSDEAWKVDQRQAVFNIAAWLQREYKVSFHFSTTVSAVSPPSVETSIGTFKADSVIVCGGSEFSALFSDEFKASGVTQCELQMLRTKPQPANWQLQPFVLGGLSLPRYSAFAECASMAALKEKQRINYSDHLAHGIHVVACQEADGSVTIGDSHHYSPDSAGHTEMHRSAEIDELIMSTLKGMVDLAEPVIDHRWLGHYAYLPGTDVLKLSPKDNVIAITMTNGQGMTHAFSVAEKVIREMAS